MRNPIVSPVFNKCYLAINLFIAFRALADFSSRDENMLRFRKGDIVAVVPKHDAYTEKVCVKLSNNIEIRLTDIFNI